MGNRLRASQILAIAHDEWTDSWNNLKVPFKNVDFCPFPILSKSEPQRVLSGNLFTSSSGDSNAHTSLRTSTLDSSFTHSIHLISHPSPTNPIATRVQDPKTTINLLNDVNNSSN